MLQTLVPRVFDVRDLRMLRYTSFTFTVTTPKALQVAGVEQKIMLSIHPTAESMAN